jgi:hypothetical protein
MVVKNITKDAILSKDRKYRYLLSRIWDDSKPKVVFIGLNPSTADELEDDPTITRCINFANSWGYGGIYMLNLFAYRTTYPKKLFKAHSPIGRFNNKYLIEYSQKTDKVICAWGNDGKFLNRSSEVKKILKNTYYLKLNKSNEPAHPLYLKKDLLPIRF